MIDGTLASPLTKAIDFLFAWSKKWQIKLILLSATCYIPIKSEILRLLKECKGILQGNSIISNHSRISFLFFINIIRSSTRPEDQNCSTVRLQNQNVWWAVDFFKFGIFGTETTLNKADLITYFKIMHNHVDVEKSDFFSLVIIIHITQRS